MEGTPTAPRSRWSTASGEPASFVRRRAARAGRGGAGLGRVEGRGQLSGPPPRAPVSDPELGNPALPGASGEQGAPKGQDAYPEVGPLVGPRVHLSCRLPTAVSAENGRTKEGAVLGPPRECRVAGTPPCPLTVSISP